jgi:membrane dipeptidase
MIESMEKAWQSGLDILNPSEKDLQHGLELHKESIVVDSYGFSPTALIDKEKMNQLIDEDASPNEIMDHIQEMLMTGYARDDELFKDVKEAWERSGVTCVFQNAGEEGQSVQKILKRHANYTYTTDFRRDFIGRAVVPEDIIESKKAGKHCLYFSANGVPLAEEWNNTVEELKYINYFFKLGCRMMHLTYNRRNMLGDGCGEKSDCGLSDLGEAAVKEMNRVGVIVDVAHCGQRTSFEAAKVSSRPVVASHSSCADLHMHIRGKTNEVIEAIAESGGYIGMCCLPFILKGSEDIRALIEHIDYAVKRYGADHVAIGTDRGHTAEANLTMELKPYSKGRPDFRALWPEGSPGPKTDISMSWTNWPLFTVGLVQKGYSDEDIKKIIGGNVLRVASEALK